MTNQQKAILKLIDQIIGASKELKDHPELNIYESQVFSQIYKKAQAIGAKFIMSCVGTK